MNTVNTVNTKPCESELGEAIRHSNVPNGTFENQQEKDSERSVHGVNDVHVFTDNESEYPKEKCPHCEYGDHPFFIKFHVRNAHPEQQNDSV